jgi:hypothetical protein
MRTHTVTAITQSYMAAGDTFGRRPPTNLGLLVCDRKTDVIAGQININNVVHGRFQCGAIGYAAFAPPPAAAACPKASDWPSATRSMTSAFTAWKPTSNPATTARFAS